MDKSNKRTFEMMNIEQVNKIKKVLNDTNLLDLLKNKLDCYLDESLECELIEVIENNIKSPLNRCLECGCDMGENNPRQLCGKTFCYLNN
jgi:hypothetical protein